MALARTLQEQLTCPICQDIFTDPMVLKCHHSICQECLEGLKHASLVRWKVECPVCRNPSKVEDIQRDFRTVTLLEAHKSHPIIEDTGHNVQQFPSSNAKGMRLCDLCVQSAVKHKCKECQKMLCEQCSRNHRSIPACHNHSIQSLKEDMDRERATLKHRYTHLKKQQVNVTAKAREIQEFKQQLESAKEKALQDVNQWYESIVQRAARQRDRIIEKINNAVESERSGVEEKERSISAKEDVLKESIDMIEEVQLEDDPGKVLGTVDSLKNNLDNRSLDDSPHDLSKMVIPPPLDVKVHVGKRWDETKALHVSIKKQAHSKHADILPTFPSNLTRSQLVRDREVKVSRGTKQILVHHHHLWCLYDDRIDIYDNCGRIIKSLGHQVKIPNGMAVLPNQNIVVACMSEGLVEFTSKGKYVGVISEGNMCGVSSDHKTVYSLDYTDNRPVLKAYKKKQFKWKKVIDKEIQNDKCNTFNTILSNQTSVFISATEENVLIEYNRAGELVSRMVGPTATHLCCSDAWGNVILTNYHQNEVWMYKNDQTWKKVDIAGVERPYSVSTDEDGGVWVSNHTDSVVRYVCPLQTL